MEEKMLNKVNYMAQDLKKHYDKFGFNGVHERMLERLYGALDLLTAATGKEYVILEDGSVIERTAADEKE